jgi:two-component system phosphate regulon sensor histidine kinase PhoR
MARRLGETEALERNFLMTVTHELRTPLTAIRGHVDALREGLAEDPAIRAASLEVVADESSRLERLVGDILDLAKLDAHRFTLVDEEVDVADLLASAHGAFAEEARRRTIDYPLDLGGSPLIVTDGDRVHQIVLNLITNAFRWTPDGGRIAIALTVAESGIEISVEDTGSGIPPEEQDRVFRPFFTRGGGTGLGLAIARELAVALGGKLTLRSEPGVGSRFGLALPLRAARQ